LASCMLTLTYLLHVLGTSSDVIPEAQRTIREIIEATALDDDGETRQSLISLLSCIEPDSHEPCLRDRWNRVRRTTKECLKASAAIARKRPSNYKVAIHVDRDPAARKALRDAAWATSQLTTTRSRRKGDSQSKSSILSERSKRDVTTAAVKASIEVCKGGRICEV
jgi:hypothetical protein